MGVAHKQESKGKKEGQTMKLYTINYKLFACVRNEENLLDAQTGDFIYKTRQKALQSVKERIKTHQELCDYKPTENELVIETQPDDSDLKFRIVYEIKEFYLSDYE